jgi:hypothetical protein
MGVQWQECEAVAKLIGLKTIVNEFVAYEQLGKLKSANKLSVRQILIPLFVYPDTYLPLDFWSCKPHTLNYIISANNQQSKIRFIS